MKLSYYINGKQVSSEEYEASFLENAVYAGQTKKLGRSVIAEDRDTAEEYGHCQFTTDDYIYEIKRQD